VLALEALKRLLSNINRNRDMVVGQAMQAGLVPELLALLDWREAGGTGPGSGGLPDGQEQDRAVLRVLAIDVLSALAQEGVHMQQVTSLLDASNVWSAYRHQRHDLFLPSGASAEGSVVGLLAGPQAAVFALPAPEQLAGPQAGSAAPSGGN